MVKEIAKFGSDHIVRSILDVDGNLLIIMSTGYGVWIGEDPYRDYYEIVDIGEYPRSSCILNVLEEFDVVDFLYNLSMKHEPTAES